MELTGTTAIVTGANGGLGEAFVKALADECETVYAGVRKPDNYKAPAKNVTPDRHRPLLPRLHRRFHRCKS